MAAHVVLHLTLCGAMMHAPTGSTVDVKLHATDHTGRQQYDRNFTFQRGDSAEQTVEFDSPRGVFLTTYTAPKFNCNAQEFQVFIEDESRNMRVTLTPGKPQLRQPTLLVGTAPAAFLYEQPTFVLLDKSIDCGKPVDSTLPADIESEYDSGSFHLGLYPTPDIIRRGSVTLAFKVTSSTGDDQYVRLKFPYPRPWSGWPYTIQFNLPEGVMDELATEQKGVLLCPKIYETSGG